MTNKQIATLELGLAEAISSHSTCGCRAKPVAIPSMRVSFADWIQGRAVASLGTNSGAEVLPFQGWRHFKEAFAPELIERAVAESPRPVRTCVDPFGGSGTTALACQFLGVHPIINEVNPFLADLIEAKLTAYSPDRLARDLGIVLRVAHQIAASPSELVSREAPATFIEPGDGERWIFDAKIAARIASLRKATDTLANETHRRFFRVLLGGILVAVSNVVVSGKGRRYRRRWQERQIKPSQVDLLFRESVHRAISDVHRYRNRATLSFNVIRGDSRETLHTLPQVDLAVFSPPYPNSFDYTDVYNLELWALGYLLESSNNSDLRSSTVCSHVQLTRDFPSPPKGSRTLDLILERLGDARDHATLWNRRIPEMVGGYFADLIKVLNLLSQKISPGGSVWMVVGDSCYADVRIPTADIVAELLPNTILKLQRLEPFRSMRASAQQGGKRELRETLVAMVCK